MRRVGIQSGGHGDDTGVGVKDPTSALTLRALAPLPPGGSQETAAIPISSPYFPRPLPTDQLTRVSSSLPLPLDMEVGDSLLHIVSACRCVVGEPP